MIVQIFFVILFLFFASTHWRMIKRRSTLPPGPFPWPVVGNLLQIDPVKPQKTCQKLSKIYGPVFTFWIANEPMVMVTDYDLMKDAMTRHGDQLAGRPTIFSFELITKGKYGLVLSVGDRWKEQRRFSLQILRNFGLGRNIMEQRILSEAEKFAGSVLGHMDTKGGAVMDIAPLLQLCVGNVMFSILFGHTFGKHDEEFQRLKESLNEDFKLVTSAKVLLLNSFHWLRHVPLFGRFGLDDLRQHHEVIEGFVMKYLKAHIDEFDKSANEQEDPTDFIDAYLKEMKRREQEGEDMGSFSQRQLMFTLIDLMIAGMETTVNTLRWAILAMVKYPKVQEKVIEEIDNVLGREKTPGMADRQSMPYVVATLNEVQRWGNILPVNLFHTDENDIKIGGHTIPKNVIVVPQISVLAIDEKVFPEPEIFLPERFLEEDGKTFKNVEQFAPFSMGKRQCLGEGLARAELFLILVYLMQRFKFGVPDGAVEPSTKPVLGLTVAPVPFECSVTRR